MSVNTHNSIVIDRPVATLFNFFAREHVRNHPRWDPDLKMEQITADPIGVGTLIRRRNVRYGKEIEEIMEVTAFVPNKVFDTVVRDSPVGFRGHVTFEPVGSHQSRLDIQVEFVDMDQATLDLITTGMQRSITNIKRLIETETSPVT